MSDPNYAHEFEPNKRGVCKRIVGGGHCGLPEDHKVHKRFSFAEPKPHPDTVRLNAVIDWLDARDRAYPSDLVLFEPLSTADQKRVNAALKEAGVIRDRITADLSRRWCEQLRAAIKEAS